MDKIKQFFKTIKTRIKNFFLIMRFPFLKVSFAKLDSTWKDFLPAGWNEAFGMQMFKEMKRILKKAHFTHKYFITDIKEKWGELCIYDCGVPEKINDEFQECLQKYQELSTLYCIHCGRPTQYKTEGWINYICNICKEENPHCPARLLTWNDILNSCHNPELFKKYWAKPNKIFKPNSKAYIITGAGSTIGVSKIKILKKDGGTYHVMRKTDYDKNRIEYVCEECVFKTKKEVFEELKKMLDIEQVAAVVVTDETI